MRKIKTRNILLNEFNKNIIIAEIGVFKGEFSKLIYENLNPKELHLIDLFEGMHPSGDKDGKNITWANLDNEYKNLVDWSKINSNLFVHKGKSENILKNFNDEHFDLIYIDGDHSYDGVKKDLELSYLKIKKDGYICGHDYTPVFQGVIDAVNEFCIKYNQNIEILTEDGCPTFVIKIKK